MAAGEAARFIVLTGLSGSGKSEAVKALEDLGYFCVDNLPSSLVPVVADLSSRETKHPGVSRVAVVVDMRDPFFLRDFPKALRELRRRKSLGAVIIFLEASDEALVQRFSETRRPHPLAFNKSVIEGITKERHQLEKIKLMSDKIFDTSQLKVYEFKHSFLALSMINAEKQLTVTLLSFGYKNGVPLQADLLFDVRFIRNPYLVPALRDLTGRDRRVVEYIQKSDAADVFLEKTIDLLNFVVPQYAKEGKSYLTIGIGCTGGRHRSVAIAKILKQRLSKTEGVRLRVRHRDILLD